MSTIKEDQRRLDNIANMYNKTSGDMKEVWKKASYLTTVGILRTIRPAAGLLTPLAM